MSRRTSGLTLVELLLAVVLGVVVIGLALSLVLSSHSVFTLDRARTNVNQNLRSGMDIMMADVRQAGERLGPDIPAVEVTKATSSDTLTLRRNMLNTTLPVCADPKSGSSTDVVFVAKSNSSNPECKKKNDPGAIAALNAWEDYRLTHGTPGARGDPVITAFIYDPVTGDGEFFTVDATDSSNMHVHRASGSWQYDYSPSNKPRLYVLQQRKYSRDAATDTLQLTVDDGTPQNVVAGITAFDVDAYIQHSGGAPTISPGPPTGSFNATNWQAIGYVKVSLTGQDDVRRRPLTRTLVDQATPRNVLSSPNAAN